LDKHNDVLKREYIDMASKYFMVDTLLCIGISPFHAHGWIIEKNAIPFDELRHQHGGARGRDTWWIEVKPDSPPAWMDKKGDFTEVYKTLININKR